jgi:hypothetical protein
MYGVEERARGESPPARRRSWRRIIGIGAVVGGIATIVQGLALAFSAKGLNETPASPLHLWTGLTFRVIFSLPPTVVLTVVLAIVAGTEGGRSRCLGIIAGVLAIVAFFAFGLAGQLLPIRY